MKKKTFLQHLKLLRKFCGGVIIFFLLIFCCCYFILKNKILNLFIKVLQLLEIHHLIYFNIYDGFLLPLKLSLYISIFFSSLLLLVGLLMVLEIFYKSFFLLILPLPLCFLIIFKYLIPITWQYFYSISPIYGVYMVNITDVLAFIYSMIICGLVAFYVPLILFLLYTMGIISLEIIKKIRGYWAFTAIVISGILAPADVLSHILMSSIMILFFEILYGLRRFFTSGNK